MESNSGFIIDPYEADQEKEKWKKKLTFGLVLVLRGFFHIALILVKVSLEVIKNVLKTFKILPS